MFFIWFILKELMLSNCETKLIKMLNGLSFDEVLALKAVMYLGRYKEYDSEWLLTRYVMIVIYIFIIRKKLR